MDSYITGSAIKNLREKKQITQAELADKLCVSSKAVSKWETGKGLPDINLIEPLSAALGVSVMELMSGDAVINQNISSNILPFVRQHNSHHGRSDCELLRYYSAFLGGGGS